MAKLNPYKFLLLALIWSFPTITKPDDDLFEPLFEMPKLESLIGYWPLDSLAHLRNVKDNSSPRYSTRLRLVSESQGPHCEPETSFTASSFFGQADYHNLHFPSIDEDEPVDSRQLTLSFYFYKHDIEGEILSLYSVVDHRASQILRLSYSSNRIIVEGVAVSDYFDDFRVNEWNFYAITISSQLLTVHRPTGDVIIEFRAGANNFPNITIGSMSLKLGPLTPNDKLSCILLFGNNLSETEISRLPCVCQMKGRCPEGTPLMSVQFNGPRRKHIAGFWPLDKDAGLGELAHGLAPTNVSRHARLVTALRGPFGQPETSYTVNALGSHMADFVLANFSRSFTISFFLYTKDHSPGGEILRLHRGTNMDPTWIQQTILRLHYEPGMVKPIFVGRDDLAPIEFRVQTDSNGWAFFALTYRQSDGIISGYNGAGTEVGNYQTSGIFMGSGVGGDPLLMSFGHLHPNDRLACLMVWGRAALPQSSISELPIICETGNTQVGSNTVDIAVREKKPPPATPPVSTTTTTLKPATSSKKSTENAPTSMKKTAKTSAATKQKMLTTVPVSAPTKSIPTSPARTSSESSQPKTAENHLLEPTKPPGSRNVPALSQRMTTYRSRVVTARNLGTIIFTIARPYYYSVGFNGTWDDSVDGGKNGSNRTAVHLPIGKQAPIVRTFKKKVQQPTSAANYFAAITSFPLFVLLLWFITSHFQL